MSRQWLIDQFGFEKCISYHTLFVKKFDNKFLVVMVYVNDILFLSTDDDSVSELKAHLSLAF